MSQPTPDELAQVVADHFSPPYRAEDWEYVRDDEGNIVRDENGFRRVRYFTREHMDQPDSPAMTTFRTWGDGETSISVRPLTFLEIAAAVLEYYKIEKKT